MNWLSNLLHDLPVWVTLWSLHGHVGVTVAFSEVGHSRLLPLIFIMYWSILKKGLCKNVIIFLIYFSCLVNCWFPYWTFWVYSSHIVILVCECQDETILSHTSSPLIKFLQAKLCSSCTSTEGNEGKKHIPLVEDRRGLPKEGRMETTATKK